MDKTPGARPGVSVQLGSEHETLTIQQKIYKVLDRSPRFLMSLDEANKLLAAIDYSPNWTDEQLREVVPPDLRTLFSIALRTVAIVEQNEANRVEGGR